MPAENVAVVRFSVELDEMLLVVVEWDCDVLKHVWSLPEPPTPTLAM
jgi:hypothetical protein